MHKRTVRVPSLVVLVLIVLPIGGAAWAGAGAIAPKGETVVGTGAVPGALSIDVAKAGPVELVYQGLQRPAARDLALTVQDAAGSSLPVVPTVETTDGSTIARSLGTFEAPGPGRYWIRTARSIEIDASIAVSKAGGSNAAAFAVRMILGALIAVFVWHTIAATLSVKHA